MFRFEMENIGLSGKLLPDKPKCFARCELSGQKNIGPKS